MTANITRKDAKPGTSTAFARWVADRFDIRPGEGRLVVLISLYTLGSFIANVLAYTAAYALFLEKFSAQTLPYIYIGESIFSSLLTLLYLRLSQRYTLTQILFGQLGVILLTLFGYRLGLLRWTGGWFIFSLPIWYAVLNNLMGLAFWNLLGRLFNIQQGKRLFGLLTAGQEVATVSMGLLIPLLVVWMGTPNLLLLAAVSMGGAGWALTYLVRNAPLLNTREAAEIESTPDAAPENRAKTGLWADPYIRLIFVVLLLFGLCDNLIDNLFYQQAGNRFSDQNQLATFLGAFTAIVGGINLLCQLFLASPMLRRFGVYVINLLTPAILLAVLTPFTVVGALAPLSPLLFWLAVALNLSRRVTDKFDNTAGNLLYQPLPSAQRGQTQTIVDGIFNPVVGGLAGLLLLYLNNVLAFTAVQLAWVLLPLVIVWVLMTARVGRLYGQRVQQALRQRLIQGNSAFQPDRAGLDALRQYLADPQPGSVLYALGLLEATASPTLAEVLPGLLEHPSPAVRLDVLARLERSGDPTFLPTIQRCLQHDRDPQVQAAALQTVAALGGLTEPAALDRYLGAAEPQLRQAAMIGLLRSGGLEGILAVGETLTKLIDSTTVADRVFAAQVLGESRLAGLHRPLLKLLHDAEPKVQQAALGAVAKIQHPQLWPVVITALAAPQTRAVAQTALIAGGEAALPALQQVLTQAGPVTAHNRHWWSALAYVCGRIGSPQSRALLVPQLTCPDLVVRTQILAALHQCGYQADVATRPLVDAELQAELGQALLTLTHLVSLSEPEQASLQRLRAVLHAELVQQQMRLLLWLALRYDPAILQRVRTALALASGLQRTPTEEQRAYALETLDLLLPKTISKPLLLLLDDLPPTQQLRQLAGDALRTALPLPNQLAAIITGDERWVAPWLKAIALYTVADMPPAVQTEPALQDAVAQAAASPDFLVQETAAWVMAGRNGVGNGVLLTIEKVLTLQQVELFATLPTALLVELAARLTERFDPAETIIFEKGAPGDSLYLIVRGAVEALDGEHVFNRMGEREIFGEMALLDGEPRTATIRTAQPTHLLCLDQAAFYELMDEHIEIARGVIHVLLQRLRARTADLNRLQAQLAHQRAEASVTPPPPPTPAASPSAPR
ncbi:MAG: Npt1/Npt2 family nucleotide transporter [Caldilineaceae bacterium]